MENAPSGALEAPDRFTFIEALYAAGLEHGQRDVGLLPYRMLELYQRLVTEWRLWRAEPDALRRAGARLRRPALALDLPRRSAGRRGGRGVCLSVHPVSVYR